MEKIARAKMLRDQFDSRWEEYAEVADSLKAAREDVSNCRRSLAEIQDAPKLKKKGNVLILLSILLIILEIMMLTETFIHGYSDFDAVDIVIIGVFLIWGIIRKKNGLRDYRKIMSGTLSADDLNQLLAQAEANVKKYEEIEEKYEQAQNELSSFVAYHGKNWDLSSVRMTASNMQQLECDLPDLMLAIAYTDDDNFVYENWFCLHCMNALTNSFTNDTAKIAADKSVRDKLGGAESWILVTTSLAMSVFELEVTYRHFNDDKSIDMQQALAMSQAGSPRNETEKAYFELLELAVPRMINAVVNKLKAYR